MTPRNTSGQGSPTEGEPWLAYIRVSTWKEEKISPELQRAAIEAWERRTGRRVIDWIDDLDVSGRHFKRKIMKCIERVEGGEARGVVVWKYSRFGRSRDGIALNLKRLHDAGGELDSATEDADSRTATGRLQRGILFEFAAYESDVRGEGWKESHEHRRTHLRLPATGRPRFGYVWHPRRIPDGKGGWTLQDEKYVADPETGPVMADRYRQYLDGEPFYALLSDLNNAGWRTTRGGLWTAQTLIRYMDSGFCAGLLRIHNPECRCAPHVRSNCQDTLLIPGAQEELIDLDLWQQYRDRRQEMKRTPPRARTALYPLTNLVRCAGCRGTTPVQSAIRMVEGKPVSIKGHNYMCGRRAVTGTHGCEGVYAARAAVEEEVGKWLRKQAPAIDAAPSVPPQRDPVADPRAAAARERARLDAEAAKLKKGLANLRADRAMNPDDYEPGEYEAAVERIRQQQAVNTAALERVSVVELTPRQADYEPVIVGLAEEWATDLLSAVERNGILKQLIRRVALVRQGKGFAIEVHPMWEPDPWA
ncbi:recombinase family protein [Streptomyces sp. WAC01280]|uniref:recombinase family protein n=1 Tax=Streptomyces sp. WAC01280 TaxID=2487424 RepID=UPI000F79BE4A|nr:recombinase family protein [Streptomyces sp. WAC01280]RSS51399.1 recombinase family protein [Streptomyces sp. WAC01280]